MINNSTPTIVFMLICKMEEYLKLIIFMNNKPNILKFNYLCLWYIFTLNTKSIYIILLT